MVRRVINIVYREIRGLHQAAYVLALFTFGSQLLALIRDRMLAYQFGADAVLDIYYTAFKIPDLLYVLFASTLSVYVLIPFITKHKKEKGEKAAKEMLSQVFSVFLVAYSVIALVVMVSAPILAPILFPGILDQESLVLLMRILLLQPFFLGLSSLLGVVTQLGHRFILFAISPLIYNLGVIFGVVFLYPNMGIAGLGLGVVIGAIGHMAIQLPLVQKSVYSLRLRMQLDTAMLKEIFLVSLPRTLTLSLNQVVLLILLSLAGLMTVGSVSVFQFAYNLQSVPLAVIGVSYSVAAFPVLSKLYSDNDLGKFRMYVTTALRHIIFWSIPAMVLIIVLRAQIVRVILGSGSFNWDDTRLTAAILAILIISLVAHAINLLVLRVFYAAGYTKLPLYIISIGSIFAIIGAWLFIKIFTWYPFIFETITNLMRLPQTKGSEVLALAIGYTLSLILEAIILLFFLNTKFKVQLSTLAIPFLQAILAATLGGMTAYISLHFLVGGINASTFLGIFLQGFISGLVGLAITALVYTLLNNQEMREIHLAIKRNFFKTEVVNSPQQDVI